jgi:hypothetical protein
MQNVAGVSFRLPALLAVVRVYNITILGINNKVFSTTDISGLSTKTMGICIERFSLHLAISALYMMNFVWKLSSVV